MERKVYLRGSVVNFKESITRGGTQVQQTGKVTDFFYFSIKFRLLILGLHLK